MIAVLIILILISASKAQQAKYTQRCRNSSDRNFTFEPSEDKIVGRYKLEYCTETKIDVIKWILKMQYIDPKKKCVKRSNYRLPLTGSEHSHFDLSVTNNLNCTEVCFLTFLDLVYNNTCYYISTNLKNKQSPECCHHDSYHYITNNYTKEFFTNSKPTASTWSDDKGKVEVKFYLGHVPASFFNMDIEDNETKKYGSLCNVSGQFHSEVSCLASLVPGHCYTATLKHESFWRPAYSLFGNVSIISHKFCVSMPGKAGASASPTGEWPTALATAGLLLAVVTVWCIIRRRHVAAWQKRVRDHWLQTIPTKPTEPSKVEGNILLLYARDCAAFKRAAESLGVLVQRATGCQVIDVYSGTATQLWAPAPDEWLRLLLARDDTRVLLLQSPAGVLLAAELTDTRAGPGLVAPLLGTRVMWRRPHAGDALLSLALRQLAAAPSSAPYKKYYVANIGGHGADMAASVTPHRRYSLPEAAACLLRDLAPSTQAPDAEKAPDTLRARDLAPLLQHFTDAAAAFTLHVRDHPDYLADELLPEH